MKGSHVPRKLRNISRLLFIIRAMRKKSTMIIKEMNRASSPCASHGSAGRLRVCRNDHRIQDPDDVPEFLYARHGSGVYVFREDKTVLKHLA